MASATNSTSYAGAPLRSRQRASWQVRVWDANGEASAWSARRRFEMGLLEPADWGAAKWINLPAGPAEHPRGGQRRRTGRALCPARRDQARPRAQRGGLLGAVSRIQLAELALTIPAGGANRSLGASVSASTSLPPALEPRRARRRRAHEPGLQEPPVQDAEREPVEVGAARPRRHPSLRHAAALSAHRRAHAGRAESRTSRSTTRCRLRRRRSTRRPRSSRPSPTSRTRPARTTVDPLPIFARPFTAPRRSAKRAPLRRRPRRLRGDRQRPQVTDTVLNPGVTQPAALGRVRHL